MATQVTTPYIPPLPELRIIALDALVEHEHNDAQRTAPLAKRLEAEGLLKNPPIVSPLEDDTAAGERYVVLDGANRTTALQLLGYLHVLTQVVPYEPPQVTLTTWHHVIAGIPLDEFTQALTSIEGLEFRALDLLHARAGLARRDLLSYTIRADGVVFAARTAIPRHDVHEQNRLLNAMVDTYKERGQLFRAAADHLEEAQSLYPGLTGLVIFPNYDAAEVLALARDGELLPTGLTRHLIQGRALRTNYPLSELKSNDSLDAKNARLREWLKSKSASKEMRLYGEATYLFDE